MFMSHLQKVEILAAWLHSVLQGHSLVHQPYSVKVMQHCLHTGHFRPVNPTCVITLFYVGCGVWQTQQGLNSIFISKFYL